MDKKVASHINFLNNKEVFSGWAGVNNPGEIENLSGLWVTKAGAKYFPKGFLYNPEKGNHWEWGAILDGKILFEYESTNYEISEGDSYLMAADMALNAKPVINPFIVWIEISGHLALKMAEKIGGNEGNIAFGKYSFDQVKYILKIAELLHDHPFGYELAVHANLWNFFSSSVNPVFLLKEKMSKNIRNAINFIDENLCTNDCSLPVLSQVAEMSLETFRKRFHTEVGTAPFQYVLKSRIKRAKELLSYNDLSIKQIAFEVGFEDQYYFSRLFKKYEGLSPLDFKRHFYPELQF